MNILVGRAHVIRLWGARVVGPRLHGLVRAGAALILITGAGVGAWLYINSARSNAADAPTLDGTWELSRLNGAAIGEASPAGIVSQRIALRAGKLRGETVVRFNSDAPTAPMPFPDETVDQVIPSADESGLRVLWSGTYRVDDGGQMTLRIGKAVYFVKMKWRSEHQALEFNQDVILTVHGDAHYRRAGSTRVQ
jgi:hypothetical protein